LLESANRFSDVRAAFESSGASLDRRSLVRVNELISRAEQLFTPDHRLPGLPWYRHYVYAPGRYNGYSAKTLPGVREALERRPWREAQEQIVRVAELIDAYAARIDEAAKILDAAAR